MKTLEQLAREAHDLYERLAPEFGYETRTDTRQFDPQSANGRLMMAVYAHIRAACRAEALEEAAQVADAEAEAFGGVAVGPMATERGKLVHEAMAAGAKNCAAAIREMK